MATEAAPPPAAPAVAAPDQLDVASAAPGPDLTRKHPLQRQWAFWFDEHKNTTGQKWMNSKKVICNKITTVEEFWCLFNTVKSPSTIEAAKADLFFWLDGVKPDWDVAELKDGGLWNIEVKKLCGSRAGDIGDDWWMNLASPFGRWGRCRMNTDYSAVAWLKGARFLAPSGPTRSLMPQMLNLIGEQFDGGEDIVGMACRIRKKPGNRFEVWTKTAKDEELQMKIGKQIKAILSQSRGGTLGDEIGFVVHEDARHSRNVAPRYTV